MGVQGLTIHTRYTAGSERPQESEANGIPDGVTIVDRVPNRDVWWHKIARNA